MKNEELLNHDPNYKRLTAKDMDFNGCVHLVSHILKEFHDDYVESITWLKNNEKIVNRIYDKVYARKEYEIKRKRYLFYKESKHPKRTTLEYIANFKKIKAPRKITSEEKKILSVYGAMIRTKRECEKFYLSETFFIFTLGTITGKTLIAKLKKQVGYKD